MVTHMSGQSVTGGREIWWQQPLLPPPPPKFSMLNVVINSFVLVYLYIMKFVCAFVINIEINVPSPFSGVGVVCELHSRKLLTQDSNRQRVNIFGSCLNLMFQSRY